jgi:RND family efflux transporter MFP subunit
MKTIKIILVCLPVVITGCTGKSVKEESIRSVKCDTVKTTESLREESIFPGKVKAAADVNLAFRISGPVTKVFVSEGKFVRKGDVIAEMDPRDYQIQLNATEAEFKRVKSEADRVIELYNKQSATPNDYDKAVYGLQQITAKLNAHRNALADTKLRAPFDGYIQKKFFDSGETISAGMPVVSLISATEPEVEINIPTADFIKRGEYSSATSAFDIFPGVVFRLELIGINQKANLNQLYTTRFKIISKGKEKPAPGMTTMVTIHYKASARQQAVISVSALFGDDNNTRVWLVRSGSITAKQVKVSEITTEGKAIVTEGLSEGDIVVSAGTGYLQEGQKVKILPGKSKTNVGGVL